MIVGRGNLDKYLLDDIALRRSHADSFMRYEQEARDPQLPTALWERLGCVTS